MLLYIVERKFIMFVNKKQQIYIKFLKFPLRKKVLYNKSDC